MHLVEYHIVPHFYRKTTELPVVCVCAFFNVYFFLRERDTEIPNLKQDPGSELSAQSLT